MYPKTILIDLLGPLADLEHGLARIWEERFPNDPFIWPEQLPAWEDRIKNESTAKLLSILTEDNFFLGLQPTIGCRDAIRRATELGHKIFVCASPLRGHKRSIAEQYDWVERNLGDHIAECMIVSHDKTILAGNVLINNGWEVIGSMVPRWHQVVFESPYNRKPPPEAPRINWKNWERVMANLLAI